MNNMDAASFGYLKERVLAATGVDLDDYKSPQLNRRLRNFMEQHGAKSPVDFARMMEADARLVGKFKDFMTINVSEFYRNPAQFDDLTKQVLPSLLKRKSGLRIWSAGCAHGAEIYTVIMLLSEIDGGTGHTFLGTDIDEGSLEKARRAWYGASDVVRLPPALKQKYFIAEATGFRLKREISSRARFRHHNLLKDPFPSGWDLILCRNVVIYFTAEARDRLYKKFNAALNPGGVLFIGGTEVILKPHEMGFKPILPFFYEKFELE